MYIQLYPLTNYGIRITFRAILIIETACMLYFLLTRSPFYFAAGDLLFFSLYL